MLARIFSLYPVNARWQKSLPGNVFRQKAFTGYNKAVIRECPDDVDVVRRLTSLYPSYLKSKLFIAKNPSVVWY